MESQYECVAQKIPANITVPRAKRPDGTLKKQSSGFRRKVECALRSLRSRYCNHRSTVIKVRVLVKGLYDAIFLQIQSQFAKRSRVSILRWVSHWKVSHDSSQQDDRTYQRVPADTS